jgi:hypothetical protein
MMSRDLAVRERENRSLEEKGVKSTTRRVLKMFARMR